jgi:hypothetical protein
MPSRRTLVTLSAVRARGLQRRWLSDEWLARSAASAQRPFEGSKAVGQWFHQG